MIGYKVKPIGDASRQPKVAPNHGATRHRRPPGQKKEPCKFCEETRNKIKRFLRIKV